MNLDDALEQLDAIHSHLARSETYHGYRPFALIVSGVAGLLAGIAQPSLVADEPSHFVTYWLVIAVASAILAGGLTVIGYFTREDEYARRRTRTVLGLFAPCLFVGAVLTYVLTRQSDVTVIYLPGVWAMVYALGIIASSPYLPRAANIVAIWYLTWGLLLFALMDSPLPVGWTVGVPFGVGQVMAGFICWQARKESHS